MSEQKMEDSAVSEFGPVRTIPMPRAISLNMTAFYLDDVFVEPAGLARIDRQEEQEATDGCEGVYYTASDNDEEFMILWLEVGFDQMLPDQFAKQVANREENDEQDECYRIVSEPFSLQAQKFELQQIGVCISYHFRLSILQGHEIESSLPC